MTEFRLENDHEQDRDNVQKFIENKAYHRQAEETAYQDKSKDEQYTCQELPGTGIADDSENAVKKESTNETKSGTTQSKVRMPMSPNCCFFWKMLTISLMKMETRITMAKTVVTGTLHIRQRKS